jgi:hypothetical protein
LLGEARAGEPFHPLERVPRLGPDRLGADQGQLRREG